MIVIFLGGLDIILDILRHLLLVLIVLLVLPMIFGFVVVIIRLFLVSPIRKNLARLGLGISLSLITPNRQNLSRLDLCRLVMILVVKELLFLVILLGIPILF